VSATTRGARAGETHGVHYWFLEPEEFVTLLAAGDLMEWAEYDGRRYGTLRRPVVERLAAGEDVLLEIEVQGARQVRSTHPEAVMFFIVPPGLGELEDRLRRRGDTSEAEISRRLQIAAGEISEAEGLFDHVVINDSLERAIDEVAGLMEESREVPAESQARPE
jgi:guanylate kinase